MIGCSELAVSQLGRMRGMNRFYHQQFFADVRYTTSVVVLLFVIGFWDIPEAFLLIPPVALLGAAQTAFDASYLIFSRHYSTKLENALNEQVGAPVLLAAEMENRYLFPLDSTKVVTASLGRDFSWFGFMTLFYTVMGVLAFAFSLTLGWETLRTSGGWWTSAYTVSLGSLVIATFATGWWWFVSGVGERRLRAALAPLSLR